MAATTFLELLCKLKDGRPVPFLESEGWRDFDRRARTPGVICELNAVTWGYFPDGLEPCWTGCLDFACVEGESIRYFWREERWLCRLLTREESALFCRLAGIPLPTVKETEPPLK